MIQTATTRGLACRRRRIGTMRTSWAVGTNSRSPTTTTRTGRPNIAKLLAPWACSAFHHRLRLGYPMPPVVSKRWDPWCCSAKLQRLSDAPSMAGFAASLYARRGASSTSVPPLWRGCLGTRFAQSPASLLPLLRSLKISASQTVSTSGCRAELRASMVTQLAHSRHVLLRCCMSGAGRYAVSPQGGFWPNPTFGDDYAL
mmetsp:Transcript_17675/g.39966  ORF Transcript_17675/g.39966 Transcript_17675/m.39966 type:complete len:200 (-) Transcript_17675:7-606(-)